MLFSEKGKIPLINMNFLNVMSMCINKKRRAKCYTNNGILIENKNTRFLNKPLKRILLWAIGNK